MSDLPTPTEWTSSDAWILAAISTRQSGSSLAELIGEGDAINHGILTRDELASGIGALRAADLVEVDGGRFLLTGRGRDLRKHWKRGMFRWGEALRPRLAELPRSQDQFAVSDAEVDAAYREYTRTFGKRR